MSDLKTTIGLEIHVQLKTKSKMFCRCDNEAFGVEPNTTVCPICLAMPGSLPVANKQAILWTIKTGLALHCDIPKIAKFDRKHYFYPDLPKGYQISQYDEPFAIGGWLRLKVKSEKLKVEEERTIRITRVHLEEDAGKLIHKDGASLVDLNRAGTPLMEIVSEPDITSPTEAGEFLRKLQKIVRDEVAVSEASMEKGHLRCDANISVSEIEESHSAKAPRDVEPKVLRMSEIVELKNLNSFRFVEKALAIEEKRLKEEYPDWNIGKKVTRGYDSKQNITFAQRTKEEAADYRYFPEPDLPPFDTTTINVSALKNEIGRSEDESITELVSMGIANTDAKILLSDKVKEAFFRKVSEKFDKNELTAKAIVHNYFGFPLTENDLTKASEYLQLFKAFENGEVNKNIFAKIAVGIHKGEKYEALADENGGDIAAEDIITEVLEKNTKEVEAYKAGKKQLFGFFVGEVMKATKGQANPAEVNRILREKLDE